MIYIATTTINSPSIALKKFTKDNNYKLIVALDKNSKKFKLKNSIVLTTSYQEKKLKQKIPSKYIYRDSFPN